MKRFNYPRPDLIADEVVPIVITALFDLSKPGVPRLMILRRSHKVENYKGHWAMPAGVIDNFILRSVGPCDGAALLQSQAELAGELFLFPEHIIDHFVCRHYLRPDPDKKTPTGEQRKWGTFLVVATTRACEDVYHNWEHDEMRWFSVRDLLFNPEIVPEPRTSNLLSDLESLKSFMESLLK